MRFFVWLLRAFIFFSLFAFALNNQQAATVNWFFGVHWHAPMVIQMLVVFAAGCTIGVLAMLPSWWRLRRLAHRQPAAPAPAALPAHAPTTPATSEFGNLDHPPRVGP